MEIWKLICNVQVQDTMTASAVLGQYISNNASSTDTTAVLILESTSKGILIPRMTSAQRTAINNPANGLLVFQTDGTRWLLFLQWNRVEVTSVKCFK